MPVFIYQAQDAELYGFEGEVNWKPAPSFTLGLIADYTHATLVEGGNLPRIPPLRIGARAEYEVGNWRAEFNSQHYFEQDRLAERETPTGSYILVDAQLSYRFGDKVKVYLKGNNLTNEYARVHASFLKDKAPLPARSYALGISGSF